MLIANGTPDEVLSNPQVRRSYRGASRQILSISSRKIAAGFPA